MKVPVWTVIKVEARKDYKLIIDFADGTRRLYDARALLEKPVCAPLKELAFFMNAKAECGTVVWSDDVDIAPEHLYECSELLEALDKELETALQRSNVIPNR